MSLAQVHYAGAPDGPPGLRGTGSRFTAVTPGVPAALLREAERLIGYEPPEDAPPRPTEEQLASFPVALSLSTLSDGSRLLARTVCTGADPDDPAGRPGGFHAHAVHLPGPDGSGAVQGALPITAWGSPQWASRTPPGGPPPPLAKVPAPGRHDAAALAAFVAARGPWLEGFFADVRRLGTDPGAPRIVLVEPDSGDVARWVMLACSVLPHRRGQWLTFTTYTRRPERAPQQLIGVRPGGDGRLAGAEQRYRIHAPAREPAPAGSAPSAHPWARTAARVWLAGRPQLFAEVRRLPGDPYDAGPLAALALAAGIPLDAPARAKAADWAAEHGDALDDTRLDALHRALNLPARPEQPPAPPADRPAEPGHTTAPDHAEPTGPATGQQDAPDDTRPERALPAPAPGGGAHVSGGRPGAVSPAGRRS
ncbi:GTPase-associated protein 1-related protein, partial [Streptomyces sp. NPDC006512]|uniref:GTPase-associated protein 1-related protein n=1 Tax=Streptomyces sp. NPDC006512 TaxID=3154307 RepID=UPI0033B6B96E